MNHFLVVLTALMLGNCSISFASSCVPGTLASYIALGSTGCTIGTNTLSDFGIPDGTTAGATEISPSAISLSGSGGSFHPTLTATVNASASAGNLLEAIFTYQISGSFYTAETISLSQSSESGDGAVTDIQNYCAGGFFFGEGCSGTPGSLLTLDGFQNQDSVSSLGQQFVSVIDDLTIDGGLAGSASGGKVVDMFTAIPEPSTLFFVGMVLISFAAVKTRRKRGGYLRDKKELL